MIEIHSPSDIVLSDSLSVLICFDSSSQWYYDQFDLLLTKYAPKQQPQLSFMATQNPEVFQNLNIGHLPCVYVSSPLLAPQTINLYPGLAYQELLIIYDRFLEAFRAQQDLYHSRIKKLLQDNPILLFIVGTPEKPMCRFTSRLIQKLQPLNIRFGFYDIEIDKAMVPHLRSFSKWPTFPQVFIAGKLVGGADKDHL